MSKIDSELPKTLDGYDALSQIVDYSSPIESVSFRPNTDYDRYFRIHKVLVGDGGARLLEQIHYGLSQETMPRYLSVAGSAAAESALMRNDMSTEGRLGLLDNAVTAWRKAIPVQKKLNNSNLNVLRDYALPSRLALDIATAPLIGGIIEGDVTTDICKKVFKDCLNIAEHNIVQMHMAALDRNEQALGEHIGLAYECNALLAFNRRFSPTWFAMPAMARCDSGVEYYDSTHDLLIIHQKWGKIRSAAPAEIKASASLHDRNRYKALLVRGKMHLSVPGKYRPEYTLAAIAATCDGTGTSSENILAEGVSERLKNMVRDYYAGQAIGMMATRHSLTTFHDTSVVIRNHPGLEKISQGTAA